MNKIQDWWDSLNPHDRNMLANYYYTSDKLCLEEIEYIYNMEEGVFENDHNMIVTAILNLNF